MNCAPTLLSRSAQEIGVLQNIADHLLHAGSLLSMAHPFADGDAIGSQLALHHFARSLGKRSVFLNFDPIPEPLQWLPGLNEVASRLDEQDRFDVFFLMETTDKARMGDRMSFLRHSPLSIHLDHHPNVAGLGHLNFHDEHASSTCEILYEILQLTGRPLPREVLTCIYVGMMTDTGNFRFSNSTPRAHQIAGEIIAQGIGIADIFKRVYEANPLTKILIHGLTMSRTRMVPGFPISYAWLKNEDFTAVQASVTDSDGAINQLCTISGVEVAAIFREQGDGDIKISLRSNGHINVQVICKSLGGGGHRQAAGAQRPGSLETVMAQVLELLKQECTTQSGSTRAADPMQTRTEEGA